jgi:ketosteroid isomerase-like protein
VILASMASKEPATPDLVELTRRSFGAAKTAYVDGSLAFFAPDAVWTLVALDTKVEGVAAIRGFLEDWDRSFEDLEIDVEDVVEIGAGVTLAVVLQSGRPVGSTGGRVSYRLAFVAVWADDLIVRAANYTDIDEARAAVERLAQELG